MDLTVNNLRLHVEEHGQGPPLLLLHAFPLRGAMWAPQVAALQNRYRLIIPDIRGFGDSELPGAGYTLDDVAQDLIALLDQLGIAQAIVGGLSMGGYLAFALYRQAPERVRALILADTKPQEDSDEARQTRYASARTAREQGAAAIAEAMVPRLLGATTLRTNSALADEVRSMIGGNQPEAIAAAQEAMAVRPDSRPLLPQLAVPTLIVVGAEDLLTPPADARAMQAAMPNAQLAEIAAAGHLSNLEQPEQFSQAVAGFLATFSMS